jgi:hypothetical protein
MFPRRDLTPSGASGGIGGKDLGWVNRLAQAYGASGGSDFAQTIFCQCSGMRGVLK